jgi:hypothetical protein
VSFVKKAKSIGVRMPVYLVAIPLPYAVMQAWCRGQRPCLPGVSANQRKAHEIVLFNLKNNLANVIYGKSIGR